MSIDLSRFHSVFFEESFEAVNAIESGLLNVDLQDVDPEEINTIFRAAHSIKGGSATFGFQQVADYTHVMENLLDDVRDGKRQLTQEIVDVLFGSVDTLRTLLAAAQSDELVDAQEFAEYQSQFDTIMSAKPSAAEATPAAARTAEEEEAEEEEKEKASAEPQQIGWRIVFTPHKEMMQRGNDPLRLIRELKEIADAEVSCDVSMMPDWGSFEPLNSYLGWTIVLNSAVEQERIEEVFSWVEDECDLAIVPVVSAAEAQTKPLETEAVEQPKPATPAKSTPAKPTAKPKAATPAESQSIRVDLDKVDSLINLVGELVITQSMLNLLSEDEALQGMDKLLQGLGQLQRQTRALQEGVMQIRMMPISFCFSRFPRMVRDLSKQLEKDIELILIGETTEVDKTVIEKITDPLVHLVRNSVDHGVEPTVDREPKGKPQQGTIWLRASHQAGNVVIEVEDDGKGLDPTVILEKAKRKELVAEGAHLTDSQIHDLIFLPGFSTKEEASDLSGRGVGMDVVKRNVQSLGGSIWVDSELGKGSKFTIRLPLTLAIMDGQLIKVGEELYVVPLGSIVESLQPGKDMINLVGGVNETIKLRGSYLPVLRLAEILGVPLEKKEIAKPLTEGIVIIVEHENHRFGLFVDDLLSQQQIVIKSLDENYRTIQGVSAATILGDGRVALILDVAGLNELQNESELSYADAG